MKISHENASTEILRQRFEIEKLKLLLKAIEDLYAIFEEINSETESNSRPPELFSFVSKLDKIEVQFAAAIAELNLTFHIDLSALLADEIHVWKTECNSIGPRPRGWPNLSLYSNCYYWLTFPSTWSTKFNIIRQRAEARLANLNAVFGQNPETKKKNPGRPSKYVPETDKEVSDEWKSKKYLTHEDLGVKLGMSAKEVARAIDRDRKRSPKE